MWGHHVIFSTCVYFTCEPRKKSCITMAPKLLHCAFQKLISLFSFLVSIQFFPTMSSVTLGFHCLDRWELANSCLFTISFINWGKCHSGVFLQKAKFIIQNDYKEKGWWAYEPIFKWKTGILLQFAAVAIA